MRRSCSACGAEGMSTQQTSLTKPGIVSQAAPLQKRQGTGTGSAKGGSAMRDRSRAYRQLWRVVDGAVFDALYTHPEYLTAAGKKWAQQSIVKRVTGEVLGYAEQAWGRSEESSAPDRVAGDAPASRTVQKFAVLRWRAIQRLARQFLGRCA